MALSDNRRLYDIATRLAIYTEDVKVTEAQKFAFVLRDVGLELRRLLGRVKYKTLDGLSKAQLNLLIAELRKSQSKIYTAYTQQLIDQLREFMAADLEVNRRVWATAAFEFTLDDDEEDQLRIFTDEEALRFIEETHDEEATPLFGLAAILGTTAVAGSFDKLWSSVTNSPIPANGLYMLPFIKAFSNSAQASVESLIRKAWANGWTIEETLSELLGDGSKKQGATSQMQRLNTQATAVIHTSFAHVAAIVSAAVMSSVFGWYCWFSVMDRKTSDICRGRNLKKYRFGKGPLPPGHFRCRSHIGPVRGPSKLTEESFYAWLALQPKAFQDDILGEVQAQSLREEELPESDLPEYKPGGGLTFSQFKRKLKEILSRRFGESV